MCLRYLCHLKSKILMLFLSFLVYFKMILSFFQKVLTTPLCCLLKITIPGLTQHWFLPNLFRGIFSQIFQNELHSPSQPTRLYTTELVISHSTFEINIVISILICETWARLCKLKKQFNRDIEDCPDCFVCMLK